jgi:hypothetical protein
MLCSVDLLDLDQVLLQDLNRHILVFGPRPEQDDGSDVVSVLVRIFCH